MGARVRASIIAVAAGWMAAMVVTLPIQVEKIYTNAIGGLRPLLWSWGVGALIWAGWLLAIAAGAWLFGGLPVIAIVRESWLLRNPRLAIAISAGLGWLVVLTEFQVWKLVLPDEHLAVRGFSLYTLLMVVFTTVATSVYLLIIGRMRSSGTEASCG